MSASTTESPPAQALANINERTKIDPNTVMYADVFDALCELTKSDPNKFAQVISDLPLAAYDKEVLQESIQSVIQLKTKETPNRRINNINDEEEDISEEEANKYVIPSNPKFTLNLEPDNFLMQYIAFGREKSDAYPDYWFAGGLELLAIINDRKTFVKHRVHDVYANVYLNLLGRSSVSFKTSVMENVDICILRIDLHTHQYHAAATSGSPEGWLEGMGEYPRSYCHQDESSQYLTRMRKNDYMAGMTEDLNKVYSGTSLYKRNTKKRSGNQPNTWEVKLPYYNQMYATTPEKFSLATTASDIHSGFWVRFLHFYPNYPMDKFTPLGDAPENMESLEDAVIKQLQGIQKKMANPVATRMYLAPDGMEHFKKWQEKWHHKVVKTNDDFLGQIVRPVH